MLSSMRRSVPIATQNARRHLATVTASAIKEKPPLFNRSNKPVHFESGAQAAKLLFAEAKRRDPGQPEFLQAVDEVLESLAPVFEENHIYAYVFKNLMEPERIIQFRVPWTDDVGSARINRAFRVQYNSALGPYKGGLRLHPTVNQGVIKFLGFEQIFKNALTTLPMGGGKGGSDFDPKGKSEAEIVRFCQSFMTELSRYIGPSRDVPAGDIGVGGKEIGYMFGQYKRVTSDFSGILTGKGRDWGGSLIRPEATGYGCVYYAQEASNDFLGKGLAGLRCAVSGSGNVAQYTAEKLLDLGAVPLTFSDSGGYVYEPNGFNREQLAIIMDLKNNHRGKRVSDYLQHSKTASYVEGKRPWEVACDMAFPSATQNEISGDDAKKLLSGGCKGVFEGANMPSTPEAIEVYEKSGIIFGPGKAANAGGVAVSGLEMSQNFQMESWTREEVDVKLSNIMKAVYIQGSTAAKKYGDPKNLKNGSNIAGFLKVANAMIDQGGV